MTGSKSCNGGLSTNQSIFHEVDEKNIVITVFRRHVDSKDLKSEHTTETNIAKHLQSILADIQILYLDQRSLDDSQYTKLADNVSRLTVKVPRSFSFDLSSYRHNELITKFEHEHASEVVFDIWPQSEANGERPLKLALFDMDSTLINEEVIDELARSIGISDAVSAITARAMNGDIDFATSLKERVAMLKGVPITVWEDLKKTVKIATGAKELIAGLKERGVFTGVVSGGFTPMAEWLKGELGLDVAIANHLLESAPTEEHPFPHISGQLNPEFPIVTPELKRNTLLQLSAERSIPLSETLAVGDGSNDLLMLGAAGLGIAWRAKTKVQIAAPMRLNGQSLAELLHLIGPGTSANQD